MSDVEIVNLDAALANELERIERTCFPTTHPNVLLCADDIRAYASVFPEGYFVAMVDGEPVGMGAGIFVDFDFDHPEHTFADITGEHQCGNHLPNGEWYYGTDMTVLPEYRRRGIGSLLLEARKDFVRRSGRRGIIAGGALPGFSEHKTTMTARDYADKVIAGELRDPTLSFQLANGFAVRGLLENYIEDDAEDGWATLVVWENPDYQED